MDRVGGHIAQSIIIKVGHDAFPAGIDVVVTSGTMDALTKCVRHEMERKGKIRLMIFASARRTRKGTSGAFCWTSYQAVGTGGEGRQGLTGKARGRAIVGKLPTASIRLPQPCPSSGNTRKKSGW